MHHVTDVPEAFRIDDEFGCECDCDGPAEPWRWLFYDDRDDAFEAVEAAELLGLTWRLSNSWSGAEDAPRQQWVVEIMTDTMLPEAANGSITRDVE